MPLLFLLLSWLLPQVHAANGKCHTHLMGPPRSWYIQEVYVPEADSLTFRTVNSSGQDQLVKMISRPRRTLNSEAEAVGQLLKQVRNLSAGRGFAHASVFVEEDLIPFLNAHRDIFPVQQARGYYAIIKYFPRGAWYSRIHDVPPRFARRWDQSDRKRFDRSVDTINSVLRRLQLKLDQVELAVQTNGSVILLNIEDGRHLTSREHPTNIQEFLTAKGIDADHN